MYEPTESKEKHLMTIEKLRPSFTFTEERLRELQAVVPEAFADGKINWEVLREALGDYLEEESQEHFGLTWPGKREARRLAALPPQGTLVPVLGEGIDEATTRNIFIEGENLEVLKLLQKSYAGRVKMIYIDPPYNTGNDFVYEDDYSEPQNTYLERTGQVNEMGQKLTTNTKASGRFHSRWLSMMYPRLLLARQLLREDGFMFVSIDDNEASNLQPILNEIFGEENHLATFYVQVRYPDKTLVEDADFHKLIEMVFVYSRSPSAILNKSTKKYSLDKFVWQVTEKGAPDKVLFLGEKKVEVFLPGRYQIARQLPSDANLKEIWATGKILDGNSSGRFFRDYLTGRSAEDGLGALYKVEGIGDDQYPYRYFTGPKKASATKGKYYQGVPNSVLENLDTTVRGQPIPNFYNFADSFGNCRHEGNVDFRSGKKPIEFIKTLLRLALSDEENQIVFDFFAGSCSTAHALMDHNRDTDMNHQYVVVQLPEPMVDSPFLTIADLGKERIRRSIQSMLKDRSSKSGNTEDLGFRVLKLDRSNFIVRRPIQPIPSLQLDDLFNRHSSPLVPNWRSESLMTEILLLEGFLLDSSPLQLELVTANTIWRVHHQDVGHELYICLDEAIVPATLDMLKAGMLVQGDNVFICLDSALSDEAKVVLDDRLRLKVI